MIHNTFFYKNRGKILKKSIKNDKILISRFGGDEVKNLLQTREVKSGLISEQDITRLFDSDSCISYIHHGKIGRAHV